MIALRPGRDDDYGGGESSSYGDGGTFEAAVGRLDDPLNDPLPGQTPPTRQDDAGWYGQQGAEPAYGQQGGYGTPSPGYEGHYEPSGYPQQHGPYDGSQGYDGGPSYDAGAAPYRQEAYDPSYGRRTDRHGGQQEAYGPGGHGAGQAGGHGTGGGHQDASAYRAGGHPGPPGHGDAQDPSGTAVMPSLGERAGARRGVDETVALRVPPPPRSARDDEDADAADGGRAARRRAAQNAGRRGGPRRVREGQGAASGAAGQAARSTPASRVEARRAERAMKDGAGVIASRLIGEAFITMGVLMLLFVTYQLWWTNVLAHQQAGGAANNLEKEWKSGGEEDRSPGAFSPGQGFAIMYIPKLDVKVPIAEGIDKHKVLDHGMVGHYGEGKLKTAMPWDEQGNFAVAGHRNTHGEPFRYINRLKPGDEVIVETRSTYYTYEMASILPQTSPANIDVIRPVPPGSGFTGPGRYVTLTTCTPEFTSTYRMIVWGKMVDERPRSKGKPDALVG